MTHPQKHKHAGQPEHERWERLSRWLKRHQKTITILSALSVLASFVVKEALDEPAQDLLTSIAAAIGDNNQEQAGMYNALTNIDENVEIVKEKVVEDKPVDDADFERRALRADHRRILEVIGENIGHMVVLENVLPSSFKKGKLNFEQKYGALGFPGDQAPMDALRKSASEWQALEEESNRLRGEGLKEIMELRERTEVRHHIYQAIAYISFALGWVIGLVSNLAGGKIDSAIG
jgi:hypothetical protein